MKLVANVKVTENVIEFETHDKNVTFYWSLTVQKSRNRGLLHGSCREMLIDERVRKQHWHLDECYRDVSPTETIASQLAARITSCLPSNREQAALGS